MRGRIRARFYEMMAHLHVRMIKMHALIVAF